MMFTLKTDKIYLRYLSISKTTIIYYSRGLKTEYSEYEKPSDVKMKEIYYCPVDTPYNLPAPGNKSTFAAPNMYNTEYQNIGSRRPITC